MTKNKQTKNYTLIQFYKRIQVQAMICHKPVASYCDFIIVIEVTNKRNQLKNDNGNSSSISIDACVLVLIEIIVVVITCIIIMKMIIYQ